MCLGNLYSTDNNILRQGLMLLKIAKNFLRLLTRLKDGLSHFRFVSHLDLLTTISCFDCLNPCR